MILFQLAQGYTVTNCSITSVMIAKANFLSFSPLEPTGIIMEEPGAVESESLLPRESLHGPVGPRHQPPRTMKLLQNKKNMYLKKNQQNITKLLSTASRVRQIMELDLSLLSRRKRERSRSVILHKPLSG